MDPVVRVLARFSTLFPLVIMVVTAVFGVVSDPELVPLAVGGVLAFAGIYGWLRLRRGGLLAPGIAHGPLG